MIDYRDAHRVLPGDRIVAEWTRVVPWLTKGRVYEIIRVDAGVFVDRPFARLVGDDGEIHMCHLSRFAFADADMAGGDV